MIWDAVFNKPRKKQRCFFATRIEKQLKVSFKDCPVKMSGVAVHTIWAALFFLKIWCAAIGDA